jgi:hypothetical protein
MDKYSVTVYLVTGDRIEFTGAYDWSIEPEENSLRFTSDEEDEMDYIFNWKSVHYFKLKLV